jgi:signal transduction histidine kinase
MAFTIGFVIFGTIMFFELNYSLAAGRDKTLTNRGKRVATLLDRCRSYDSEECTRKFADLIAAMPEGNLIRIFNSAGDVLHPIGPRPTDDFPWPQTQPTDGATFIKVRYHGGNFRVLSEPVSNGADHVWIVVAGQLKDNALLLRQFRTGLLFATPPLLLFSAMFGYFMGRRALAPVSKLAASARSISIGNLSRRLPIVDTGDEIQDLAETCNELIERLESTANEVSRFTADASHELRSPISYIYTLSESALRNPNLDEESSDAFKEIVRECSEATRLLDDMLTLARFDAGHADTAFARLNLAEVLADSCDKARPFVEIKHQQMKIRITESAPVWVLGDIAGLRRLFWILLDNAIKYTPASGAIDVTLATIGKDAVISVTDTGIGIPKADLPDVFRRFYRVDKARSVTEGAGLGLSIAKWISDIHRGELSVSSSEDLGTTFQISLRLAT